MKDLTKKSLEKLPPHDFEAEQAVLGAILLDPAAIHKAGEFIGDSDFYRPSHQKIFHVMRQIVERDHALDLLLLRDELARLRQLDEVGGAPYIAELSDKVPTAANIIYHARIIRELALKRALLTHCIESACNLYDDHIVFNEFFPEFLKLVDDLRAAAAGKFFPWVLTKNYQPVAYKEALYVDWLANDLGFRRFPLKSGSLFLQVEQEHILVETRWTKAVCETVKDAVRQATTDAPGVYDMLIAHGAKPFSHVPLTGLPCVGNGDMLYDTKDCCRLFFNNGCVETTSADGSRFYPYSELPGHIWKDAIVPRDYLGRFNGGAADETRSDFERVVEYVTTEITTDDQDIPVERPNAQNKKVCEYGLFNLIHGYNDPVNPLSTIFIDDTPNKDFNDGGRGKGLLIGGIYQIRSNGSTDGVVIVEDGRSFAGNFKFQRVAPNTQVLILDDVDETKVSIKDFYAWLTGTAVIEGKGKTKFAFTPEHAPKIGFTANRPFFSHDISSSRRILIVPLTNYFNQEAYHPLRKFKRRLFYEWDQAEWARFDDYFLRLIAANIRIPALEIPKPDLTVFNQYRLIMEIDEALLNLFDAIPVNTDCKLEDVKTQLSERTGKEMKDADIYKSAEIFCRMKKYTLKKSKDGMRYRKNHINYLHFEDPLLLKKMKNSPER